MTVVDAVVEISINRIYMLLWIEEMEYVDICQEIVVLFMTNGHCFVGSMNVMNCFLARR